jgi:hypothetical protein
VPTESRDSEYRYVFLRLRWIHRDDMYFPVWRSLDPII